jgi:F-type H+-transporting ATPase subunit epsilon
VPVEVHIVTPEREVWSGQASMLIARGVDGEVGILGGHAPMLVQLAIGPMRVLRDDADDVTAVIDGGFLHVGTDQGVTRADVLAGNAELVSEIDVDGARRRAAELEDEVRRLQGADADEAEVSAVRTALRRAQVRVDLAG